MRLKFLLTSLLIFITAFQPLFVFAQTPPQNTATTNQTINRFNPAINGTGGGTSNTFGGLQFSGVGGAVLSCANIGQTISQGVSSIFKSAKDKAKDESSKSLSLGSSGASQEETPVTDKKATEEAKKQTQRENCLNGVAYAASKNLLQSLSAKTLNWVGTGFNGNPLYVQDVGSYLTTIRDKKISAFLENDANNNSIFGSAVRSAITQQVTGVSDGLINVTAGRGYDYEVYGKYCKRDLISEYDSAVAACKSASNPTACVSALDQSFTNMQNNVLYCISAETKEFQGFQQSFSNGGWTAWLNATQNDDNNPVGAMFKASDQITASIAETQEQARDEIQRNEGFLDMKKCVEFAPKETCSVDDDDYTSCLARQTGQQACLKYQTVTPGSIISQQVSTITNSAVRQLENADKINEVLGSFFDTLLNRLFNEGISGLANETTSVSGGYGDNVILDSNGNPIQMSLISADNAFGYEKTSGGFFGEFDISRPQQLRSIIQAQANFLNRSFDAKNEMNNIIPTLGELDYCLPGPNPSWRVGTQYNTEIFMSAILGKAPSKTLGSTISAVATAAAIIPGPGWIIGLVGNVVGIGLNLAGGDKPREITASNVQLFDKVTNGAQGISTFYAKRRRYFDNISLPDYLQDSYKDLMARYETAFSSQALINAFLVMNPGVDPVYVQGQAQEIIDETTALTYYGQSVRLFEKNYEKNITDTQDALYTLNSINQEALAIVATAKARYIREQAAKGTPVDMQCLNQAYVINTAPVVGARRQTVDAVTPAQQESYKARDYFYGHL